ncbi:MAG TPA: xylose isomerase [Clostridiales bacterium]|nr:xylose isomerase [Clostridiales bacterium]
MNEPIKKYMKVGIIHFMAFPECIKGEGPILDTLKIIANDNYFDAVEMTWIKDPETRREAARIIDVSGMAVGYGGQPRLLTTGYNINDLDESKRLTALASLKEGIDEAYELGAKGFAFLAGKYEESTKEESYGQLVKSTRELCAYAKSKGDMRVMTEVFDYDIEKRSLIGPAALAKRFAEDILADHENFGLMVDLSHIPQLHETIEESLRPVKEYITHAHIGTCVLGDPKRDAYGDQHPRFNFPHSVNHAEELTAYLRALMELGYFEKFDRPFVSFEVKPFGEEDPELVIANGKRVLDEAWAKL